MGGLREVIRRGRAGVKYERIRVMKTAGERKNLIRRRWAGDARTWIFTGWRTHTHSQRQFINCLAVLSLPVLSLEEILPGSGVEIPQLEHRISTITPLNLHLKLMNLKSLLSILDYLHRHNLMHICKNGEELCGIIAVYLFICQWLFFCHLFICAVKINMFIFNEFEINAINALP